MLDSIEALFAQANRLHLMNELASAEALYREIIRISPADARAKHFLGFLLQQQGRLQEARSELEAAIGLEGAHGEWHFNLGILLLRQNETTAAIEAFRRALVLDPGQYYYWTNLGAAYEEKQELTCARECYLEAAKIDEKKPDAYYLLAALCLKENDFLAARKFNSRGIVAEGGKGKSKIVLGQAYHELGRTEDAIALMEKWLCEEPGNPEPAHLLAAYRNEGIPEQCSPDYVVRTFDAFAENFEHTLGRLDYRGPELLRAFLATLGIKNLAALDLGCGTGLAGEVLKPYSRALCGVDLSSRMLEKAAQKGIYDRLYRAEICEFLRDSSDVFDLVACMDTFIYLGKLDEVLPLIRLRLSVGGRLIFSTEKLIDQGSFRLNTSGRYSHHPDYLRSALRDSGFSIEKMEDIEIRKESGCPIAGQLVQGRVDTP